MMNCYNLSITGVGFALETEQPLLKNDNFLPFLTDCINPDVRAEFHEVKELPPVPKQVLFSRTCVCVTADEHGRIRNYFSKKLEDSHFCACAAADYSAGLIRVEYLSEYRDCVSELNNCFFHIGLESILLKHNRLCLHASCVDTPFGGLLFSGVSGIGKSTQAELWCKYRNVRQINGDRPILSSDGERWLAWGSPYAGSSNCHINDCCGVSAILLLEQKNECCLQRLTPSQAFRGVWAGLTVHSYDPSFVEKASVLAVALTSSVPVYRFGCTPDENAVTYLEKTLGKELSL